MITVVTRVAKHSNRPICQVSVLGPILFLVCIDYLEEEITGNIMECADYSKLFRKTEESGDKQKLKDDIDKLVSLSEK